MTREHKMNEILARGADETRRLALDQIDADARSQHTWGSSEHRAARERVERLYNQERSGVEKLTDLELDQALLKP